MTVAITLDGITVAALTCMVSRERSIPSARTWLLVFGGFLLIAFLLLFEEHRAHALGALPYVLGIGALLFCIFGHRHAGTWGSHHDEHGGPR